MANSVFPDDVMVSILTRLPVKSILRFKSVCKPWFKLLATQWFAKMHHVQFSSNPENQSVVIYCLSPYNDQTMSLFKINPGERKPVILDHRYPEIFFMLEFVGSCNGLICMRCPSTEQSVVLWNPAMKLFKFVRLSKIEMSISEEISLGFGCDNEGFDFKVVRMNEMRTGVDVEVYSSVSDSWKKIKVDFQFRVLSIQNAAVVNGNPYWVATVDEDIDVLVCFDVKKMVFKVVSLSGLNLRRGDGVPLVDWKGSLGAIVWNKDGGESVLLLDVWLLDDECWSKKHTFKLIDFNVGRFLQCSKNGRILSEYLDGDLFVPDGLFERRFKLGGVAQRRWLVVHGYGESLVCINGMVKVVMKGEGGNEDENEDGEAKMGDVDVEGLLWSYLLLNLSL